MEENPEKKKVARRTFNFKKSKRNFSKGIPEGTTVAEAVKAALWMCW